MLSSNRVHEFVCKKPVNGTWPTPPPTAIPDGHCRADFEEYRGYCYKLMGTEGEAEKRDWYTAKDECNNFAVGAVVDLASIHNSREDAFITTMLADLPADEFSSFWIGAGIDTYAGTWWWTDETRWDYTNWSPGEPNGVYYEVLCFFRLTALNTP